MKDIYIVMHRLKPMVAVETLQMAKNYCMSNAPHGWNDEYEFSTFPEVIRYTNIDPTSDIHDFRIMKVCYIQNSAEQKSAT